MGLILVFPKRGFKDLLEFSALFGIVWAE